MLRSYYQGGVGQETIRRYVQTTMRKKRTEIGHVMKIAVNICAHILNLV